MRNQITESNQSKVCTRHISQLQSTIKETDDESWPVNWVMLPQIYDITGNNASKVFV